MADHEGIWNEADNQDIVIQQTSAVAVYQDGSDVVIRQQDPMDQFDGDQIIHIPKDRIGAIIAALQKYIE